MLRTIEFVNKVYLSKHNDPIYARMIIRRRFCKRVVLLTSVFALSFYVSVLLFGDLKVPRVMHLTDLDTCPACYGLSVCPELYSNQIIVETGQSWYNIFNAKNIYYGYTKNNRKVVLKKLAHSSELRSFDSNLCKSWGLKRNCKPIHILNASNVEDMIRKRVAYNLTSPETEPRTGLVFCPYADGIFEFLQPVLMNTRTNNKYKSDLINIWTMLSVNPEPIILQVIPKSKGWPVPAYGGVCGRLELVAHEGVPLASLMKVEWSRRLQLARKIIDAAMDFTFKHDRFRFYLMDWSLDNIVVNEKNDITFIDLEDVIVLDKHISPAKRQLPDWYKRYGRDDPDPRFTFSIDSICRHHLSDHNIWAACYTIANEDEGLLYPMEVYDKTLHGILIDCLKGDDRFKSATHLQQYLRNIVGKEMVSGYGNVKDRTR